MLFKYKKIALYAGLLACIAMPTHANEAVIELELTQPKLDTSPYHRPYVAVWLETNKRKPITTIALWVGQREGDDKWFKDLRQWWRKIGRKADKPTMDAYSGATRLPDTYSLQWDGKDSQGNAVPAGEYLLNIEASREDGGRDYIRQKITLGQAGNITLPAKPEIGPITVKWK